MGGKLKIAALAAAVSLGLAVSGQAIASGIPTVDVANLADNIKDYTQHLKDYATQLDDYKAKIERYRQQVEEATRPYRDIYNEAFDDFQEVKRVAGGVYNMYNNYRDAISYIKDNYGDSEFWKQCAVTACNPFDKLDSAYTATTNAMITASDSLNRIDDNAQKVRDQIKKTSRDLSSAARTPEQTQQQIGDMLTAIAQLQDQMNSMQKAFYQSQVAYNHYQQTEKAAQEAEFQEVMHPDFEAKISTHTLDPDYFRPK